MFYYLKSSSHKLKTINNNVLKNPTLSVERIVGRLENDTLVIVSIPFKTSY